MRFIPFTYMTNPTPPVTTDGLALYLDANNPTSYPGTGTIWYDLSSYGNNASLTGTTNPTFATTGSTNYFEVNPTGQSQNQFFIVPDSSTLDASTGITMEFWVYYNNLTNTTASVLNKQDPSGWSAPYGAYDFRFVGNYGETWVKGFFAGPMWQILPAVLTPTGRWTQYVVTWSTSDYKYRYYNGGTLRVTSNATTATSIQNTAYPLWIGADAAGVSENFTGYMSIIRIYNKALTLTEISNNYNHDKSIFNLT